MFGRARFVRLARPIIISEEKKMIDFKKRLRHKTFVVSFLSTVLAFFYQVFALFELVPKVSERELLEFIGLLVSLLASLGILIDPTTKGIFDKEGSK